jgi:hypothetical protein
LHLFGSGESIVGQTMLRLHQHQLQVARAASSPAPAAPKGLQMLLMFAIHSRATPSARWHAYFRFIPQSYEDPLWWTGDELRHLLGTNLGIGVRHRRRRLREAYDALVPALSAFAPDVFPPDVFTWEAYLWASSAYTSRSYVGHLGRTQASAARPLVGNFVSKQDGDKNQEEEQLCGCMVRFFGCVLVFHRSLHLCWYHRFRWRIFSIINIANASRGIRIKMKSAL